MRARPAVGCCLALGRAGPRGQHRPCGVPRGHGSRPEGLGTGQAARVMFSLACPTRREHLTVCPGLLGSLLFENGNQ